MKDETYIRKFAERFNLDIVEWAEQEFLDDGTIQNNGYRELELVSKTKESIINMSIGENGQCLGYSTESRNSFVKIKGDENERN